MMSNRTLESLLAEHVGAWVCELQNYQLSSLIGVIPAKELSEWIAAAGYSGLYCEPADGCGCDINNLMDCDYGPCREAVLAYELPCGNGNVSLEKVEKCCRAGEERCEPGEAECLEEWFGPPSTHTVRCDSCEFIIPVGEEYTLDGDTLCQACYEEESRPTECCLCHEMVPARDTLLVIKRALVHDEVCKRCWDRMSERKDVSDE